MRYVKACFEEDVQKLAYRIYVTDALKILCGFEKRYVDALPSSNRLTVENRSPDEIKDMIKNKLTALYGGD